MEIPGLSLSFRSQTHIAAALVPTASFLAVPRTPPPQDADPSYTSGPLASGLLSSTMLGRLFAQPELDDANDVDTSLEDYTDPRYAVRLPDFRLVNSSRCLCVFFSDLQVYSHVNHAQDLHLYSSKLQVQSLVYKCKP